MLYFAGGNLEEEILTILFSRFTCILPVVLAKEKFEDGNFTDGKVTMKLISLKGYCVLYDIVLEHPYHMLSLSPLFHRFFIGAVNFVMSSQRSCDLNKILV